MAPHVEVKTVLSFDREINYNANFKILLNLCYFVSKIANKKIKIFFYIISYQMIKKNFKLIFKLNEIL